jgi:hypothetical protein
MVRAGPKRKVIIMKSIATWMSILTLAGAVLARADDIPNRFNFDRYQAMLDRSPFAVATAVAPPAATPDFAKDLYVANAAKSSDGDMVTLASSTDKNFKKYLSTKQPEDGYSIANIEWSDRVGATKVTISKDGKFATLTFNQALLTQSGPNASPAPAVIVPPGGSTPVQTTFPKPAPIPSLPTPPPRIRGVIPRSPGTAENSTPIPRPLSNPEN